MPGPGPGFCLRRGGGGGRASGWAPSLTLRDPARCSFSPSRLLLHLLLSARGGRQGAGAPGRAHAPPPAGEARAAWPLAGAPGRGGGASARRHRPDDEAGGRNAATYGAGPGAVLPSPAFPFSSPTRDICALRRAATREAGPRRAARRPGGKRITWWWSGFPSSWGEREFAAPQKCRPHSSIGTQKYIPQGLCSRTLLEHPSSWGKEGGTSILFSRWGSCSSDSLGHMGKALNCPVHSQGLFLAFSPSSVQQAVCPWASHFSPLYLFML